MVSGDTQAITSDCGGCEVDAANLVDQLEQAGISWKAYKAVSAGQLDADLGAGRLPRLVFITPNLDHDMHGAGEGGDDQPLVRAADDWLRTLYQRLAASSAWRDDTRLVVTWDEGHGAGGRSGCCGLLRSVEAALHLPFLGHAGDPTTATIPAIAAKSRR
jgi:Phosphoesterase family